jgi:hypothetical protein
MSEQIFSQSHKAMQGFFGLVNESLDRISKSCDEVAKMEARYYEGASKAVDEYARLIKESLTYATKLSVDMRNAAFDATRKNMEAFQAAATAASTQAASTVEQATATARSAAATATGKGASA